MADQTSSSGKIVESVNVRRVPQFNQAGGPKRFVYSINIVTVLGNSGTFEIGSDVYENDDQYAGWLRESIWQLDKSVAMTQ